MSKLNIAPGFSLPLDFVTQTQAILAKKRVGKSYTASVQAEELLKAHQQIAVIDPTGAWWGLKSSADGKSAGFPIAVFGGEHADIPLEESAGETIASALVEQRFSAIIDLSLFRKGQINRFMTPFLETLYRLNREAMHLFVDEADAIAPQKPFGEEARMLGAMEDVVRRGGIRGIGTTLITQRPAVLNKNVLTQCEILCALRIVHHKDIDAIREWVAVHGDEDLAEKMMKSLPALPIGTAWFWAPGWGDIFQQVKVRERITFDSGATPKPGEAKRTAKVLATVDIQKLGQQIQATVERVKENDPKELKKQIADLKRQLANAPTETVTKEVIVADVNAVRAAAKAERESISEALNEHFKVVRKLAEGTVSSLHFELPAPLPIHQAAFVDSTFVMPPKPRPVVTNVAKVTNVTSDTSDLSGGARKLVSALLAYPEGLTRGQARILCGFAERTLTNYVSELNGVGLLIKGNGTLKLTPQAAHDLAYLGTMEVPQSTKAVLGLWRDRVSGGAYKLLEVLVDQKGEPVLREEAMQHCSFAERTLTNYVSELSTAGLLVRAGQGMIAANKEALFL